MIDFSVGTVFVITYLLSHLIVKALTERQSEPSLPGPWGVPVLGHLPFFEKVLTRTFKKWQEKYGDIYHIQMGSWHSVVINGYSAVKEAMDNCGDAFSGRPLFESMKELNRVKDYENLAMMTFNLSYLKQRKLTATAFRQIVKHDMDRIQDIIQEEARKLIDHLLSMNEEPTSINESIQRTTAHIVYQQVYGKERTLLENETVQTLIDLDKEVRNMSKAGNPLDVLPWIRFFSKRKPPEPVKHVQRLGNLRDKNIRDQGKIFPEETRNCLMNILLRVELPDVVEDDTVDVSKGRVLQSVSDILHTAFETTQLTMRWFILYMIGYPEVQASVQHEIDSTVGPSRRINIADMANLNYTNATILEVMRMSTVAPFAAPHLVTYDTELRGFRVPKGYVAFVNLHSVHMEESFWKDPEVFRPDRFLDSTGGMDRAVSSHVIPFGLGRRRCIGEQYAKRSIFLQVSNLLQKCRFSPVSSDTVDFEPIPGHIYSPKPFDVIVHKRK